MSVQLGLFNVVCLIISNVTAALLKREVSVCVPAVLYVEPSARALADTGHLADVIQNEIHMKNHKI